MEFPNPMEGVLPKVFSSLICGFLLVESSFAIPIPVVRVLIDREPSKIQIQGYDLKITVPRTGQSLTQNKNIANLEINCKVGGKLSVLNKDVGTLNRTPSNISGPLLVKSPGGFLRIGDRQYRDDLYIYSINGDCAMVNHLDIEKYVAGVLDSEMNAKWNLQALKAQAVAARTYALYQMKDSQGGSTFKLNRPFDVDSSVSDQVYEGAHREKLKALQAVRETQGEVLTYNGDLIKSFYHSTCGGRTETPDRVWGSKFPSFRSVDCPYCYISPRFNWRYDVVTSDIEATLLRNRVLKGKLVSIKVLRRNILGRAKDVEIQGSFGSTIITGAKLRDILGTRNLKSTAFRVSYEYAGEWGKSSKRLLFEGHGAGHGVGMCQWGAKNMGDQGKSHLAILGQYYPKARITKIY